MVNGNEKIPYKGGKFCGIISSSINSIIKGEIKELILDVISSNGSIIYAYNSIDELNQTEAILQSLNIDYNNLIKKNRIIYVSVKKKYFCKCGFCNEKIIDLHSDLIDQCRKNGSDKIIIIGKRDGFYNTQVQLNDMVTFHKNIKQLCTDKSVMIFTTYVMDVFTEESFFTLMPLHDLFILDDQDESYIYFPESFDKIKLLFQFLRTMLVDKAKLHKEKQKLELLNKLVMKISYKHGQDELLDTALSTISEIVEVEFSFMLRNSHNGVTDIVAQYNLPYKFHDELITHNFFEDKTVSHNLDIVKIKYPEDYHNPDQVQLIKECNIKSIIEIPIQELGKKAKGEIVLLSKKEPVSLHEHIPFLKAVGNTILVLLEEQERSEEHRKEMIKVEKLKNLGELAGGVAHDFNNVLATILGLTKVVINSNVDENIREYLEIVYRSALDGKAIVDKIQSLTRKRSNKFKKGVNLNTLCQNSVEMAKPRWENYYQCKGIIFNLIKDFNSSSNILCDEHEIRESILNILLNAMDAMDSGGTLIVRTYDKNSKAYLEIEDTGIGMCEEVKERIFEPFYSTKESRGTGLGLSICKEIVQDHGGEIEVESSLGVGTKFTIVFDSYVSDESISEDKQVISSFEGTKALIVDDKRQVARTIGELLGSLKVQTDIEIFSNKVCDRMEKNNYDVIFCDLAMPNLSGLDLVKIVREKHPQVKFVLMTGWPGDIVEEHVKGIDYILEKPCLVEDLVNALDEVTRQEINVELLGNKLYNNT